MNKVDKSHPSGVRELKQICFCFLFARIRVAPFRGAWIETCKPMLENCGLKSRTLQGCVNWNLLKILFRIIFFVAPFRGAWIETTEKGLFFTRASRRTLQGCVNWNSSLLFAWIASPASHPSGVRELKHQHSLKVLHQNTISRTLQGCVNWNQMLLWKKEMRKKSHPSGVRELKRETRGKKGYKARSHPSGVRELKHCLHNDFLFV